MYNIKNIDHTHIYIKRTFFAFFRMIQRKDMYKSHKSGIGRGVRLGVADAESLLKLCPLLLHLGVEVARHSLMGPRLVVKLGSPLLLRVANHVSHRLCNGRVFSSLQKATHTQK